MNYIRGTITTYFKCYNRCKSCSKFHFQRYYSSLPKYNKYDINLRINNISLNKYIEKLEREYVDICNQENFSSSSRWSELQPVVQILKQRQALVENISNLNELRREEDVEIKKLAEEEMHQFESKIKEIDEQLLEALLPVNKEDNYDAIVLEIQAGVGGQEAMLFAKEIFDMYCNFVEFKGWELQIAEYLTTDIGGVRHAVALINGAGAYRHFKHEVGIHRVQRTPVTEKTGRIHTSTISVTALPQPTDVQINIKPNDLKIETKRSSGAGGQHVNTTDSAVRITHLSSGIVVECQVDRSQIKNRKMALARLSALLYQKEVDSNNAQIKAVKKSQVRSKNRNEKIRTYNYNQDRITDHRLIGSNIHNLAGFLEGGNSLDQLITKLEKEEQTNTLLSVVCEESS